MTAVVLRFPGRPANPRCVNCARWERMVESRRGICHLDGTTSHEEWTCRHHRTGTHEPPPPEHDGAA